jgi:hypothetical protein
MPSPSLTPEFDRRPPRNRVATPTRPVHSHEPLDDPEVAHFEQHLQKDHYEPLGGWDSTSIQSSPPHQHHPETQPLMEHTDTTAQPALQRPAVPKAISVYSGALHPSYQPTDRKRPKQSRLMTIRRSLNQVEAAGPDRVYRIVVNFYLSHYDIVDEIIQYTRIRIIGMLQRLLFNLYNISANFKLESVGVQLPEVACATERAGQGQGQGKGTGMGCYESRGR